MKNTISIVIACILCVGLVFATNPILVIRKTDSKLQYFAATSKDSLKFALNDSLAIYNSGVLTKLDLNQIDSISFITGQLPTVETTSATYNYNNNSGIILSKVVSNGNAPLTERGIVWATHLRPTIKDSKYTAGTSVGQFYAQMSGLVPASKYYVRSYATNCLGTTYGNEMEVAALPSNIYVPSNMTSTSLLTSTSTYYMGRSKQSDHFIVLWEPGFGSDPSTAPTGYTTDVNLILQRAEACYKMYIDSMKFADKTNTKLNNYKMMIFLQYTTAWVASGSGVDNVIGTLNLSPWAAPSRAGQTVCHEIGHCFQYQVHCDLGDNNRGFMYVLGTGTGNGYWEQTAQFQGFSVATTETFSGDFFPGYITQTYKSPFHEDTRYGNYFINFYWNYKHGTGNMVARIWRESLKPEDPAQTYMRLNGLTLQQFNDEIWDLGARMTTWDIPSLKTLGANYTGKIANTLKVADNGYLKIDSAQCIQDHGINIIPLVITTQPATVKVTFQGIAGATGYRNVDAASRGGWRYGFVALLSNGTRLYGQPASNANAGTATLDIPANISKLWLVVTGAPVTYKVHSWDDNAANDEQWPYKVKFENASY